MTDPRRFVERRGVVYSATTLQIPKTLHDIEGDGDWLF